MPIRPENKAKYPRNWADISLRIRQERAGNYCEFCGAANGEPHPVTGSVVVLTVAHLDHDPANCDGMDRGYPMRIRELSNLRALCQRCHNTYDARHRREGINERAAVDQLGLFS